MRLSRLLPAQAATCIRIVWRRASGPARAGFAERCSLCGCKYCRIVAMPSLALRSLAIWPESMRPINSKSCKAAQYFATRAMCCKYEARIAFRLPGYPYRHCYFPGCTGAGSRPYAFRCRFMELQFEDRRGFVFRQPCSYKPRHRSGDAVHMHCGKQQEALTTICVESLAALANRPITYDGICPTEDGNNEGHRAACGVVSMYCIHTDGA